MSVRQLKQRARARFDRSERMEAAGQREGNRALAHYAKGACPLKLSQVVRYRDGYSGRIGYWRVLQITANRGFGSEGPLWRATARCCKKDGTWKLQRSTRRFCEESFRPEAGS